jgi:hypothetical protein
MVYWVFILHSDKDFIIIAKREPLCDWFLDF